MKTDRTGSTIKAEKRPHKLQRRGLGEKGITAAVEGREQWSQRRVRDKEGTQKYNISPKLLAWKKRGAEILEFLQSAGLKAYTFKGQQLG